MRGAVLAAMLAGIGSVQAQPTDPITAALNQCLESPDGQSTAGQIDCINHASDSWDKRLNRVYGALMKSLDPQSRALLVTAQRSWLDYRTRDVSFAGGPWRSKTGTLAEVTIGSARLAELQQRVLTLETYAASD